MCIRDSVSGVVISAMYAAVPGAVPDIMVDWIMRVPTIRPVSYTHLTLPTSDLV